MSQEPLAGRTPKEWALIMLLAITAITVGVFMAGFIFAMLNNPQITIKGEIDLSQFTGVVIGIAFVAVTFVGYQLGVKNTQSTAALADQSWMNSDPELQKKLAEARKTNP